MPADTGKAGMNIFRRLWWKFFPPKVGGCEFDSVCPCSTGLLKKTCESCVWYKMIDSGYGVCSAIPDAPVVPWCKFVCSFYRDKL